MGSMMAHAVDTSRGDVGGAVAGVPGPHKPHTQRRDIASCSMPVKGSEKEDSHRRQQ